MTKCKMFLLILLINSICVSLVSQSPIAYNNTNNLIMKHAYFTDEFKFELVDSNQLKDYIDFTKSTFSINYDTILKVINKMIFLTDSPVLETPLNLSYFYPDSNELESIHLSYTTMNEMLNRYYKQKLIEGDFGIHQQYTLSEYYFQLNCSVIQREIWFYTQGVYADIDYLLEILMQCPTFAKIRFFDVEIKSLFEIYNLKIKSYPGGSRYIIPKELVRLWYDELALIDLSKYKYENNNQMEVFKLSHEIYLRMLKQVLDEPFTILIFNV